jgi:hypothetical protein
MLLKQKVVYINDCSTLLVKFLNQDTENKRDTHLA